MNAATQPLNITDIIEIPVVTWTREDVLRYKEIYPDEFVVLLYKLARDYLYKSGLTNIIPLDDLLQELVIYCWNALDSFDHNKASLTSFLYRCMFNKHRLIYRAEKKHLCVRSLDETFITSNEDADMCFIDMFPDRVEEISRVWRRNRKDILRLIKGTLFERNFVFREKQEDIAKDLNVSQTYVSRLIQKELKQIKEKLDEFY